MINEFKEAFKKSPIVYLQVVKKCQIYPAEGWNFITNCSNHQNCAYEVLKADRHLIPGNVVAATGFKTQVGNDKKIVGIKASRADGLEFEIFTSDLKRFFQIFEIRLTS